MYTYTYRPTNPFVVFIYVDLCKCTYEERTRQAYGGQEFADTYIHVQLHIHIYIYMYIMYLYTHIHIYGFRQLHFHIYTLTYVYIYTYIYIYIHIQHTDSRTASQAPPTHTKSENTTKNNKT